MRITENQKQNIEFKTYTCKIEVFGGKREITYDNVIWLSSNKSWILYINECDHIIIEKINDWIVDFPILYDSGIVAYDTPENIPKYVKDRVYKILVKLAKYE